MHPRGLQIHSGFFADAPVERAIDAVVSVAAASAAAQRVDMMTLFIARLQFGDPGWALVLESRARRSPFKAVRGVPRKSDKQ
jgi:hypothetical protein